MQMSCGIPALCVAETQRFLRQGPDAARQPASAPRPRSPAHIKLIVYTCTLYTVQHYCTFRNDRLQQMELTKSDGNLAYIM